MTVGQRRYYSDGWNGYPYTILLNTPTLFPNNYFYLYHINFYQYVLSGEHGRNWESHHDFWLYFQ